MRAIARCGAGTNNIPTPAMTERGIPVFNTPGANANAVKELALCGLFLASRGVMEGATRMQELHQSGEAHAQIEKVKVCYINTIVQRIKNKDDDDFNADDYWDEFDLNDLNGGSYECC